MYVHYCKHTVIVQMVLQCVYLSAFECVLDARPIIIGSVIDGSFVRFAEEIASWKHFPPQVLILTFICM